MMPMMANAAADAEERGDDRQPHRQHRAEGDQEDDDGGGDAEELAGELLLLDEEVAAELDLQACRQGELLPELADRFPVLDVLLVVAVGEIELRVGNLPIL